MSSWIFLIIKLNKIYIFILFLFLCCSCFLLLCFKTYRRHSWSLTFPLYLINYYTCRGYCILMFSNFFTSKFRSIWCKLNLFKTTFRRCNSFWITSRQCQINGVNSFINYSWFNNFDLNRWRSRVNCYTKFWINWNSKIGPL